MGNCSLKAIAEEFNNVRVLIDSGDIIELKGPKLAEDVLVGYPGYGIFRQGQASSPPLSSHDYLIGGQFYYLLPLQDMPTLRDTTTRVTSQVHDARKENNSKVSSEAALDIQTALQVLPSSQGRSGVWKVKLVINPRQLQEILSEEGNTEALIDKMRMAAATSSAVLAPRKSKSSWGVAWRPCISNVFKVSPVDMGAIKN